MSVQLSNAIVARHIETLKLEGFPESSQLEKRLKKSGAEMYVVVTDGTTSANMTLTKKVKGIRDIHLEGTLPKGSTEAPIITKNKAFGKLEAKKKGIADQIAKVFEHVLTDANVLLGLQKAAALPHHNPKGKHSH